MDSITQIVLGSAVGEAVLGRKTGYRAAAWGAVLGTIPDLDILLNPFLDSVGELEMHRGLTHSVTFCILASPVFGWLIDRIHKKLEVGWKPWTKLVFLAFFTHILIDLPTTYGTQVLFPFSTVPFTTDSVFIIDPLFTLLLLAGLIPALLFRKSPAVRKTANRTGLFAAALYLLWGIGIKSHVHSVFESSFENRYGYYERIKTTPAGPTTFLWTAYIEKEDTVYSSVYSVFDDQLPRNFHSVPKNTHLIESHEQDRAVSALLWFSRGYYTVEEKNGDLMFYDLRFGRNDFWLAEQGDFIWANKLIFNEEGEAVAFERYLPDFDTRSADLSRFWRRIWGDTQTRVKPGDS